MNDRKKFLIFMSYNEISNKKQEDMLSLLSDFSIPKVLASPIAQKILSSEELERLNRNFDERALNSSIENMLSHNIQIVTIDDEDFPSKFQSLPERPLILYAKGDLSLLEERCFAIVGTRSPTAYGKIVTEKFATKLAEGGLVIVSGLCYGVDAISHRATLQAHGKTVAIIGSGFNQIYPSTNTALANEIIASGGLVITEYPPSFRPKKYTFPRRNRLVAGVSDGVLITEANLQSGTNHTKEFALEYGKDLFAVPGNITSDKSQLTNKLIKEEQAQCVLSPEDILSHYDIGTNSAPKSVVELNFEEEMVLKLLESGECSFDFLAEKTKFSAQELSICLTTLEIRGLIRKLPAQMFGLL